MFRFELLPLPNYHTAPAHPHATDDVVYMALFSVKLFLLSSNEFAFIVKSMITSGTLQFYSITQGLSSPYLPSVRPSPQPPHRFTRFSMNKFVRTKLRLKVGTKIELQKETSQI